VLDWARAGRPQLDQVDSEILMLFTENKFHSVRTLAYELGISLSALHDRLANVFGLLL
jgi:DNA-binding Lrp family transcriptional regulator